ncbi:transporter [Phenylobacterium sp.]|uniref:transporter n=1 Tax=Phenylobacterium sp. TaxID=1871053 RepID=UPI0028127997|nr:transporter [Phenylobacterium sp.]
MLLFCRRLGPAGFLAAFVLTAPAAAEEAIATAGGTPPPAEAAPVKRFESVTEQSLEDAWWTGPMLASGAGTLPKGRWLVEPYLFDVKTDGVDAFGSLTYVLYGLHDRVTVGVIPTFSYAKVDGGPDGSRVRAGDLTVQAQYRLTQFRKGGWVPTTSIVLQQTLPTGKYDRLDGRAADGVGGGAYATTLGFYAQTYAWMPNGRIARLRLNTSATAARATDVRDDSVYGTPAGFRGRAKPGASLLVDAAVEYSATQNWVLALDLVYRHDEPTKVSGVAADGALVRYDSGSHDSFAIAPAVEYNVSPTLGFLFGVRVIPAIGGRQASVTPAVAVNMIY